MKKSMRIIFGITAVCLLLSMISIVNVMAEERSISLSKEVYEEGEPIMVTAVAEDTDSIVVYLESYVPGQDAGILYAHFSQRNPDVKVIPKNTACDLRDWSCLTPDNPQVKPYVNMPRAKYKVVIRDSVGEVQEEAFFEVVKKSSEQPGVTDNERKLSLNKDVYEEGEPIMLTASGEITDYLVIYPSNYVPGVNAGIYYACFEGSVRDYTVIKQNEASDVLEWLVPTPENPEVAPYVDLPEGEYKIVIRDNDGNVQEQIDFEVVWETEKPTSTPDPDATPTNEPTKAPTPELVITEEPDETADSDTTGNVPSASVDSEGKSGKSNTVLIVAAVIVLVIAAVAVMAIVIKKKK